MPSRRVWLFGPQATNADRSIPISFDDRLVLLHPNAPLAERATLRGTVTLDLTTPRMVKAVSMTISHFYAAQAPGSESREQLTL